MHTNNNPGQYAPINGLQLYYEIHGAGQPLILLHGGGSTIDSTWGRLLPSLANHCKVIAVELQAHGRTRDIDRPLRFEQDADDVAALSDYLQIKRTAVLGFSNGGTTALQLGIRHPHLIDKLILASATYQREGMIPGFWEGMQLASLDNMPPPLKEAFLQVNPDPDALQAMFDRDKTRMLAFQNIPDELIRSIQSPALVMGGDQDVLLPEHMLALVRQLPNAQLAILPASHGDYLGDICFPDNPSLRTAASELILTFLSKPDSTGML